MRLLSICALFCLLAVLSAQLISSSVDNDDTGTQPVSEPVLRIKRRGGGRGRRKGGGWSRRSGRGWGRRWSSGWGHRRGGRWGRRWGGGYGSSLGIGLGWPWMVDGINSRFDCPSFIGNYCEE